MKFLFNAELWLNHQTVGIAKFKTLDVFKTMMTVPDCIVVQSNKIGKGHGEAKFYISSKKDMYDFYGIAGFRAHCFMLKKDLLAFMNAIKTEYDNPSYDYSKKENLPELWHKRMVMIQSLPAIIDFYIEDQNQIQGPRGYINSKSKNYQIIREIALPLVSYIYCQKVEYNQEILFYWKLFVDFDAILEKKNGPLVLTYGKGKSDEKTKPKEKKKNLEINKSRNGQGKYREELLEQCPFCPITMIADERLLIASHIKPWAVSTDKEKIDPYNGFMLSPMYDKLFDKGFITFTEDKHIILSDFISRQTWKKIGLKGTERFSMLPMEDKRLTYLKFHQQSVFKGNFE